MRKSSATFLVIVAVLGLVRPASGYSLRESTFDAVVSASTIVIGRVVHTEPHDPYRSERWSMLEVDEVLLGSPYSEVMRLAWNSNKVRIDSSSVRIVTCGGSPNIERLERERMIWFLDPKVDDFGDWRLSSRPVRLSGARCELVALQLADLEAPFPDSRRSYLSSKEQRELHEALDSVRRHLRDVDCDDTGSDSPDGGGR